MNLKLRSDISPLDDTQEIFRKILASRGIHPREQSRFLNPPFPSLKQLIQSLGLKKSVLSQAKKLILSTIARGEAICIYGDYDADGITSTAILWQALSLLNAKVLPFIPNRAIHGYGMSISALDQIMSNSAFSHSPTPKLPFNPTLFITTDNGIVAHKEITHLKSLGKQVIVTDHHQEDPSLPEADVIVHTKLTSASGIAWTIALFLLDEAVARKYIDLATIGIVADQIPLVGVNRDIVFHGLKSLEKTSNVGLQELYRISGLEAKNLSPSDINFTIAPRINAMGRLSDPLEALRLICTRSRAHASKLAENIEQTNQLRQEMTDSAIKEAKLGINNHKVTIVASDSFHEGVVGLIAGKLAEESGKPALAISLLGSKAKGSARSIKGVNITDLLKKHKDILTSVGGHAMAAGFSLNSDDLDTFVSRMYLLADTTIDASLLVKSTIVDGELSFSQINRELYTNLLQLEPFGIGNPKPRFLARRVSILDSRYVGKNRAHLKMTLEQDSITFDSVWFRAGVIPTGTSSVIFSLDLNVWNGKESIQLLTTAFGE